MLHILFANTLFSAPGIFSAVLCILILGFTVYFLLYNSKNTGTLRLGYLTILKAMEQLSDRNIEHLENLCEAGESSGNEQLKRALTLMKDDAENVYVGRWIPDPVVHLSYECVLDERATFALGKNLPFTILGVGLIGTLILAIYNFALLTGADTLMSILTVAPFLTGLLSFIVLAITRNLHLERLQHSCSACCTEIARHIPVFNNESGTALLIDNFLLYDREMSNSVQELSNKVQALSDSSLVEAVRDGIEVSVKENIAPSIQESNQAMSDLAGEYSRRQVEGLTELAADFAHELTRSMRDQMTPFYFELNEYIKELNNTKNQVELSLGILDTYSERSVELQSQVDQSLAAFNESQISWTSNTSAMSQTLQQLSNTSEQLANLQTLNEDSLANRIDVLTSQMTGFSATITEAISNLANENLQMKEAVLAIEESSRNMLQDIARTNQALVGQMTEANHKVLTEVNDQVTTMIHSVTAESSQSVDKYRLLSSQMTQAAIDMQDANNHMRLTLEAINENLNNSVDRFATGMGTTVKETLNDFDESLAEVNGRLAASTAMVRDTVSGLGKAIEELSAVAEHLTYRKQ